MQIQLLFLKKWSTRSKGSWVNAEKVCVFVLKQLNLKVFFKQQRIDDGLPF